MMELDTRVHDRDLAHAMALEIERQLARLAEMMARAGDVNFDPQRYVRVR